MSQSPDSEALTAWADALRNGLGRVRFGDLPDEEFERILEAVPADDVDTLVVFAENASLAGLASIENSGPLVPRVKRAISARRAELVSDEPNVVTFPAQQEVSEPPTPSLSSRVRSMFARVAAAFAEEPTAFDDAEGISLPSEERTESCRENT